MKPLDDLCYVEYDKGGGVKRVYADVWLEEKISATATITEHAVESGAKVTDHYLPDQLAATCRMFISGSPIRGDLDPNYRGSRQSVPMTRPKYPDNTPALSIGGATQAVAGAVSAGLTAIGLGGTDDNAPTAARVLVFENDPTGRLRDVWELFLELRQKAILVAVGFSTCRVENLAIASLELERKKDDGDSGVIALEFKQLNFVSTQSAAAIPIPVEPRAKPKGDSVTVSVSDADDHSKSAAAAAFDAAGSALGR